MVYHIGSVATSISHKHHFIHCFFSVVAIGNTISVKLLYSRPKWCWLYFVSSGHFQGWLTAALTHTSPVTTMFHWVSYAKFFSLFTYTFFCFCFYTCLNLSSNEPNNKYNPQTVTVANWRGQSFYLNSLERQNTGLWNKRNHFVSHFKLTVNVVTLFHP